MLINFLRPFLSKYGRKGDKIILLQCISDLRWQLIRDQMNWNTMVRCRWERLACSGFGSCRRLAMQHVARLRGPGSDFLSIEDGVGPPQIYVDRCEVAEVLKVAVMIIVVDGGRHGVLEHP